MIAKKYRLKRNEIDFALKKGFDLTTSKFIVKYTKNKENFSKYCAIISKKFYKKAVERNRLKRKILEAVRLLKEIEENNLNIVLIPKKSISEKTSLTEIKGDLSKIIKKLNKSDGEI